MRFLDVVNFKGIGFDIQSPLDVFGRVPTTQPQTIVDIRNYTPTKSEFLIDAEVSGSGTSITYNSNGYMDLSVGTAIGKRIARSRVALSYHNAKAPVCFFTGNFLSNEPNVFKRVGIAYGNNYLFLVNNNGTISLSFGSSLIGNTSVNRSEWDDPLDGSGQSKVNLDLTRNFIFFITFQYLGVGGLYAGFRLGNQAYIAHQFNKTNSELLPYWTTPNLFLQYEIAKTVAGGNASTFRGICATAINNGTGESRQIPIYISNDTNISTGTAGALRPLIYFRLNPSFINSNVIIVEGTALFSASNNEFQIIIVRNPTSAFTPTWTDLTNSSVQYHIVSQTNFTNTTLTITNLIDVKFQQEGSSLTSKEKIDEVLQLTSKADGTPDIYCLAVRLFNNNQTHLTSRIKLMEEV